MIGKIKRALVVPSAIAIFGALALACGEQKDDDRDAGGGTMGGGTMGGGTIGGGTCTWSASVVDATQVTMLVGAGIEVTVLEDDTGRPMARAEGLVLSSISDSSSKVSFTVPCAEDDSVRFAVKAKGGNAHSDTYTYHLKPHEQNASLRLIRMSSETAAVAVPGLASYTTNEAAAPAAGAVYWKTPSMAEYEIVGCAHITDDNGDIEAQDLRYFRDALPSNTTAESGRPLSKGTNPQAGNGKFFIGNMTPGMHTLRAKLGDGTLLGDPLRIIVFPRSEASSKVNGVGANLFLAGIYIDAPAGATNPTPAGCN
jgi:hypothetical protein